MITPILYPNTEPEDFETPVAMILLDDILDELSALQEALPVAPVQSECPEDVWETIILDAHKCIAEQSSTDPSTPFDKQSLSGLSAYSAGLIRGKVALAERAIRAAEAHGNSQFPPPWYALLPVEPADRFAHLIGKGLLPLTWVQSVGLGTV